jgi:hypothetical protein
MDRGIENLAEKMSVAVDEKLDKAVGELENTIDASLTKASDGVNKKLESCCVMS